MYREVTGCRSCGGSLRTFLDLGNLCINAFPLPDEPDPERAPLELTVCENCSLVQLRHTVEPDLLYRQFWYMSSTTLTMRKALENVVNDIRHRVVVHPGDVVCDVGSNDSALLNLWPRNLCRVGFEPAENLMAIARESGVTVVNDYFSAKQANAVLPKKARVITAIAMFYDLDKPNEFLQDIYACLESDGVFVVQVSYLPDMLKTNDWMQVCHEHCEYYSLTSLVPLLERNGLHVFDVSFNPVNGGSVRVFCSPSTRYLRNPLVNRCIADEQAAIRSGCLEAFAERVREGKQTVLAMLAESPKPVYVLGASTKGNTLLQYYGLTREQIAGVSERDGRKWGRETVGTRLPIVSEDEARQKAKTMLVSIWPFKQELLGRESEWLAVPGHSMVFPCPNPEKVDGGLTETVAA